MTAQVLLLRGINVGGHGKLAMADLRTLLLELEAGEARTYIHSGNAVVATAVDPLALADAIAAARGFRPRVFALSEAEWRGRVAACPFPEDPKVVHAFFHDAGCVPEAAALEALAAGSERVAVRPGVIWLHAPEGIGRSKLAAGMERAVGLDLTARNGRTVAAITALLDEIA